MNRFGEMELRGDRDQENLRAFVGHVLDMFAHDQLSRDAAVAGLVHVVNSLDEGNLEEVRAWIERGRVLLANEAQQVVDLSK